MAPVTRSHLLLGFGGLLATAALGRGPALAARSGFQIAYSDSVWRSRLSPEAYDVLRHAGTEPAFSSKLDHEFRAGTYACAGCALPLYDAHTKFDSGTGWPSFYAPLPHAIETSNDNSLLEARTEVHCSRCGGHLGHVFDDGPKPTGLRYCMNGVALVFKPARTSGRSSRS
ncbi:MAG: peptide-methionine (R)-S-oxide reductase MsrB [Candidatus Eremiobacteraeota bacterium]|nr:peptide-methionine (R)-S-oxide reductase MsrB [Candidatus Eremiobacteraeota bacterium]